MGFKFDKPIGEADLVEERPGKVAKLNGGERAPSATVRKQEEAAGKLVAAEKAAAKVRAAHRLCLWERLVFGCLVPDTDSCVTVYGLFRNHSRSHCVLHLAVSSLRILAIDPTTRRVVSRQRRHVC